MFTFQFVFLYLMYKLVLPTVAYNVCNSSFVNRINSMQNKWVAGWQLKHLPMALGAKSYDEELENLIANRSEPLSRPRISLPESFDAREKWKHCESLRKIRDQGHCSNCWAVASASAMTDRQCIHRHQNFHYSAEDITCAGSGCHPNTLTFSWIFWQERGIVSSDCKPFSKEHSFYNSKWDLRVNCKLSCQPGYYKKYQKDKHYGERFGIHKTEEEIKLELFTNGPVVVRFEMYEDIRCYTKGIYERTYGDYIGGHIVKIIGWGVENDEKYWIVANSWGEEWGEKGFFRFRRGVNACGIEQFAVASLPAGKKAL